MFANTLGLSILSQTLISASRMFLYTNGYRGRQIKNEINEFKESFAFIQGTGLELLISDYGLGYDAERIRNGFNYLFNVRTSS